MNTIEKLKSYIPDGDGYNSDYAQTLSAAVEELEFMRVTLQGIADADWRTWEELSKPEEFVRWAKARARHASAFEGGGEV